MFRNLFSGALFARLGLCRQKSITTTNTSDDSQIAIGEQNADLGEKLRLYKDKVKIAMTAADIMFWEFDVATQRFYSENEPLNDYDHSTPLTIEQYLGTVHPDYLSEASHILQLMISGSDNTRKFSVKLHISEDIGWQYYTISGSPYQYDENGKVTKYVGIRKNNTELHQRKLLQEKILNYIPLSILIKDVADDYRYVFCNDESKSMLGASEDKNSYDIISEVDVARIRKTDLEVYNTGEPYSGLERVVLKDGRSYDTIVRKTLIEENGKRLVLSIRWDQSLENDLQKRSKLFDMTLEEMNAFTWVYDPDKQRIEFNDSFNNLGRDGSTVDTLEKFLSYVHPDDLEHFTASLSAAVSKENGRWDIEYRFDADGNGVYTWWGGRGILVTTILNDVSYRQMLGMTISIESHKQTENTLLKNKADLSQLILQNEQILNNMNSGLAYITTDYVVQWENISICSASLSYEAYKQGECCYKSAHNRTEPCENCVMTRAITSRSMEHIQFTLASNSRVEVFATPVFLADGSMEGIVIRLDDITEREMMIEELREAKKLAEQSDKLKSAFLANMSHEIRTPLNAIVGFSDLLISSSPNEEDKNEYISIINNNNDLLLKLINDILDLSKIESGLIEFKFEEFDLAEYFDGMVLSMTQRVINPNVHLMAVNPYDSCKVSLDRNRLAQLITNYVTNAIKYTPNGFIKMGYECIDGGIRFYVEDSGIGISDDKKSKVFHRFAKLDEFAQGTGLGLSICKAIVESMGGSIGFESKEGEGSVFWAILPCEPIVDHTNSEASTSNLECHCADSTTNKDEANSLRKTILIVEDIHSNYLLLAAILAKKFNVLHAQDGQQAVEMVRANVVNLVFMDMKMPVMDGMTATREIRKFNTQLPIVALTAHAFESDRIAALASGCDEYLVKPIDKTRLAAALNRFCNESF